MNNKLIEKTSGKNFNRKFLQAIKCDGLLTAISGRYEIDIIATDEALAEADPEYDSKGCEYRGKKTSMSEYVAIKYGKDHAELINELLEG